MDIEFVYGFGNSTLWAVAEANTDLRCAVKSSLAGSLDAVVCLCIVEAERDSITAGGAD
jgi:hypothetical protein